MHTYISYTYTSHTYTQFKNKARQSLGRGLGADHLPSVQEALGWISNTEEGVWGVEGKEGRKEDTK